jgi:hypothetical protein
MPEEAAARHIRSVLLDQHIELDVLLLGSDERICKCYHVMPSSKKIENIFQVNPSARRWGLHANVNRRVSFGHPSSSIVEDLQKALVIEARVLCSLEAGIAFAKILEMQKGWYSEFGFPGEWQNHFQGGPTGYRVGDAGRCFTDQIIQARQVFDWFITIHGFQVEEQTLLTDKGLEICSRGESWPAESLEFNNRIIELPTLWVR